MKTTAQTTKLSLPLSWWMDMTLKCNDKATAYLSIRKLVPIRYKDINVKFLQANN